ncbi:hypothetical protein HDV63DRAFT_211533 [Trichoderma sp. SZMC 28014]
MNTKKKKKKKRQRAVLFGFRLEMVTHAPTYIKRRERERREALSVLSAATRCLFLLLFFALLAWTKFHFTTFLLPDKTDSPHGTSYLKRLGGGLGHAMKRHFDMFSPLFACSFFFFSIFFSSARKIIFFSSSLTVVADDDKPVRSEQHGIVKAAWENMAH